MRMIWTAGLALSFVTPAAACMTPYWAQYDRIHEIAAIDDAMHSRKLSAKEMKAVRTLRNKISDTPDLQVEYEYRSQVMKRLGLARIPYRSGSFEDVDKALDGKDLDREMLQSVRELRGKAEMQWKAKDYEAANATIEQARKLLEPRLPVRAYVGC